LKTQDLDINTFKIYVSPLNIFFPENATAQVTVGKILKNENELQFSYSHVLTNWVPIKAESGFLSHLVYPTTKTGYRVGLEYQVFRKSSKRTYFGYETFFQSHSNDYQDIFNENDFSSARETNESLGFNFKLGHKFDLDNGFTIDLYTGLGMMVNRYTYSDTQNQETFITYNSLRLTYPVNVKLGYNF